MTYEVSITRRSKLKRIPYAPNIFSINYKLLRKHCSRSKAAYIALQMTFLLFKH